MQQLFRMLGDSLLLIISTFSSFTREELRENARIHFEESMQAGREAAAIRRKELEDELTEMSTK